MFQVCDKKQRLDFANEFLIYFDEDDRWTNEVHFLLTDDVNSKNCPHWADSNPHEVIAFPLHEEKVTVWCGITSNFILGSYVLEEVIPQSETCTVTSSPYLEILTF